MPRPADGCGRTGALVDLGRRGRYVRPAARREEFAVPETAPSAGNRRAVDPPAAELAARPRSARVGNGIKRHVVGLRRALALLALPLLFIAIVGAGSLDLAPKLGVFAVAVGVVLRALADEEGWRSILNVLRAALGWRVLVPVIVVVAVGGLLVSHHEGTGFRDLYDTWSRALLLATAAFWIIATLLRLAWYAETPLRGLVALAILATAARIVAAVFFPDAGMSIVEGALWLALVGVAVAINAAGEVLIHPESRLAFLIAAGPPQRSRPENKPGCRSMPAPRRRPQRF